MRSSVVIPIFFPENDDHSDEEEFYGCESAEEYHAWVSKRLRSVDMAERVDINHELLMVLDRYFECYSRVPEKHRTRVGKRGHPCIFHVFMGAIGVLYEARARLDPPRYFPPAPPPEPELPVQIAGIFLGEEVED